MLLAPVEQPTRVLSGLDMIKAEYREMPGLNLTRAQMQRMWGFDAFICDALIDALISARFLRQTANGAFVAFGSSH